MKPNACVVEQSTNDCLDTSHAVLVKGGTVVRAGGVLYLRTVDDGRVLIGEMLGFGGEEMSNLTLRFVM